MKTSADTYRNIVSNKLFFSGVAIIGILLSHLIGVDKEHSIWTIFYPGFVGVDIFLFFSGYGLCRSLESNPLKIFYQHRIKRIYPIMVLFTLISYLIACYLQHHDFTVYDIVCNLTTLNFWDIGGFRFEWYLSFILYLYLLFPLLYRIVQRWGSISIICSFLLLFCFLFFYQDGWFYQCAFSRIPIFLFGILCYQHNTPDTYKKGMYVFVPALIVMSAFFMMGFVQKFELAYMSAPFLLWALAWICCRSIRRRDAVYRVFCFLGQYSLEIYIANMLILQIIPYIHISYPIAVTYFTAHLFIAPMLAGINYLFKTL